MWHRYRYHHIITVVHSFLTLHCTCALCYSHATQSTFIRQLRFSQDCMQRWLHPGQRPPESIQPDQSMKSPSTLPVHCHMP